MQLQPSEPVKRALFTQFLQVPLHTPLSELSRIFEKDAFCLVVTSQRSFSATSAQIKEKTIVVALCSRIDLLDWVMNSSAQAAAAPASTTRAEASFKPDLPFKMPLGMPHTVTDHRGSLSCQALAWSFVKHKTGFTPPPSGSPSPLGSPNLPYTSGNDKMVALRLPGVAGATEELAQ